MTYLWKLPESNTITIPIEWPEDSADPPDEAELLTSGSGNVRIRTFNSGSSEAVSFTWPVPSNIIVDQGVEYRVSGFISAATGPSDEEIEFKLSGYCIGNDDSLSGTLGTEVASNQTAMTMDQYDRYETPWSSTVTITNLAQDELAVFELYRDHDGNDDYDQLIGVYGLDLRYYT